LALSRGLFAAQGAWRAGERDAARLRELLVEGARGPGVELEYAALRDPTRWTAEEPRGRREHAVALGAARVGCVRLIDNMPLDEASFERSGISREGGGIPREGGGISREGGDISREGGAQR
jgi:pantothenate synthetase